MCIIFMHVPKNGVDSDYRLILASNRDELYDRPSENMAPWSEDPNVIGGRDLEAGCNGGTWLAISPPRKKLGVLLNLPRDTNPVAKSRGQLVADFVKSDSSVDKYIDSVRSYGQDCNGFVFVAVELGTTPTVHTYSNNTDQIDIWPDPYLGFGNSLPDIPLTKVLRGKETLQNICNKFNRVSLKNQLIEELIEFLRSEERHLPDPELQSRRPYIYEKLSSIFVNIPEGRYGTRTHTIVLVAKTGQMDVIEVTLQPPINLSSPKWKRSEFHFDLNEIIPKF